MKTVYLIKVYTLAFGDKHGNIKITFELVDGADPLETAELFREKLDRSVELFRKRTWPLKPVLIADLRRLPGPPGRDRALTDAYEQWRQSLR